MDNPKIELYNLNAGAKRIVNVRFTVWKNGVK